MITDPNCKALVDKHFKMRSGGEVDIVTDEHYTQQAKWARQAIQLIERRTREDCEGLGDLINSVMVEVLINEMGVGEVYSPPRVVEMARRMGSKAGWSLDLTTKDEDGTPLGFNKLEMRNQAARQLLRDNPRLLIGSQTCTPFSSMNRINYCRLPPRGSTTANQAWEEPFRVLHEIVQHTVEVVVFPTDTHRLPPHCRRIV